MPELPEVETIRRGLEPLLCGKIFADVYFSGKSLRHPISKQHFKKGLLCAKITRLTRRAKYLLIWLDTNWLLVIHLGMTGNLSVCSQLSQPAKHCHLRFIFTDQTELRYTDSRRFGSVQLFEPEATDIFSHYFQDIGPEPLEETCTVDILYKKAQERSIPVKNLLMDSHFIAGIGNIYASESLFRARIHPEHKASSLSKAKWSILLQAVRQVLTEAIRCGGSTIKDYVNADQQKGYFQMNFTVYGREGKPCRCCGAAISKISQSGRATYFCPQCQL